MSKSKILKTLSNILWPPRCVFCDTVMDFRTEINVCMRCLPRLPELSRDRCMFCLEETDGYTTDSVCGKCRQKTLHFDGACAPYAYDEPVNSAILRLKGARCFDYADTMAEIMSAEIMRCIEPRLFHLVIPVPLSRNRMKMRTYNQSAMLAKRIAKNLDLDYGENILVKHKDTSPQHYLPAARRLTNLYNAYSVTDDRFVVHKQILLIDDVMTTGATINECARTLKNSGAAYVYGVTFAATMLDTQSEKIEESQEPQRGDFFVPVK